MTATPAQIKARRNVLGLSQTAAGKLVYVSMRTWQDWEAGINPMHEGLWELFVIKTCT